MNFLFSDHFRHLAKLRTLLFLSLLAAPLITQASHNLAGEIIAVKDSINPLKYQIIVLTYTDSIALGVDRCSANVEIWVPGQGLLSTLISIPRSNGPLSFVLPAQCSLSPPVPNGVLTPFGFKRNVYIAEFTFPSAGIYELRYFDPLRKANVINIDDSDQQTFYVETRLEVFPQIFGAKQNSTPRFLNEPLVTACTGKIWKYNPGGFDPEGDSLSYSLRESYQYWPDNGIKTPIPTKNFRFPDHPDFGVNMTFDINPITGIITWNLPQQPGIYNIAIVIQEWRDGVKLGYVIRDMAIIVQPCENDPPVIAAITDTCIIAGKELRFKVRIYDPNEGDSLYFGLNVGSLGNNGPFAVPNKATMNSIIKDPLLGTIPWGSSLPVMTVNSADEQLARDTIISTFSWKTNCSNIRRQAYQVDFTASDNLSYSQGSSSTATLFDFHSVTIHIIPPAPLDLTLTKESKNFRLDWKPSACGDTADGYRVYRKLGSPGFVQDTICCDLKPREAGFTLLAETDGDVTTFLDSLTDIRDSLGQGVCYVVTAFFIDPFSFVENDIESCATNEVCSDILNEKLYMTNDSISITDVAGGEIFLSWSQPKIDEFFPAPYKFKLFRGDSTSNPTQLVAILNYGDTTFLDKGVDTENKGYNYKVDIFDADDRPISAGNSNEASSIYLETLAQNFAIQLNWKEIVPWANDAYEIWRSQDSGPWTLLNTIPGGGSVHSYTDTGLPLDTQYCYFIRSSGSFNIDNVKPFLINDSQVACDTARDTVPPCLPIVTDAGIGDCKQAIRFSINISKNDSSCEGDTDFYTVYYSETRGGDYRPIMSISFEDVKGDTTIGFARSGCYRVTATDTLANESKPTQALCSEFCPSLCMPNIITPNGDGSNDYFGPFRGVNAEGEGCAVEDVVIKELRVYDRWGRLIYSTDKAVGPDIWDLWDGRMGTGSGLRAEPGVYFYVLDYQLKSVDGNTDASTRGWVTLLL